MSIPGIQYTLVVVHNQDHVMKKKDKNKFSVECTYIHALMTE